MVKIALGVFAGIMLSALVFVGAMMVIEYETNKRKAEALESFNQLIMNEQARSNRLAEEQRRRNAAAAERRRKEQEARARRDRAIAAAQKTCDYWRTQVSHNSRDQSARVYRDSACRRVQDIRNQPLVLRD